MNYYDVKRLPDIVLVQTDNGWVKAQSEKDGWSAGDVFVSYEKDNEAFNLFVEAGNISLKRIALRWKDKGTDNIKVLCDHWERGYGDLQWDCINAERPLPWYFMTYDGKYTNGYGVKTGANSMCFWLLDRNCITLISDVRCGGKGVILGGRRLLAATVVWYEGKEGVNSFNATSEFCRIMCDEPSLPSEPVYGGNNWYYAYGISSANQIIEDSKLMSGLSTVNENRPYMVIDDGWQSNWMKWAYSDDEPWISNKEIFPDMAKLAADMTSEGVKPGLWFRPLLSTKTSKDEWLLKTSRKPTSEGYILDPSIPEVLSRIGDYVTRYTGWGYKLLKHDFTTYDILGRWGFQYGAQITEDDWCFYDRSKTTAEIILGLYRTIKANAKDTVLIGCNTVSHLSAGIFQLQRTGDDTSGRDWERTRKMGINTLAFRMPQHNAFYAVDADCVGLTEHVDWNMTEKWLDILSYSGTPLFVSADPKAMGPKQTEAVKKAFALAAVRRDIAEPLDWMNTTTPNKWLIDGEIKEYDWTEYDKIGIC